MLQQGQWSTMLTMLFNYESSYRITGNVLSFIISLLSNCLLENLMMLPFAHHVPNTPGHKTEVCECVCGCLPRVVWESSWRPDRYSRCSSSPFRSHSCLHSVWAADIGGRRRRWWPSAPLSGSQSNSEAYSCSAWRRRKGGSDQLDSASESR